MVTLQEKLAEDLKTSIKNKDALRTSTLRMLIASIQNLSIEKKGKIEDADVQKILAKHIKQHQDSIESFKKGNRNDLVEKEEKEQAILKSYMPEELPKEEIEKIIKSIISEIGATSKSDFGKVMKLAMEKAGPRANGKIVSGIVQALLT
ncbi:MAG: GatB/YqeY domain-containing protein [Candidatus Omnitrophota bacterium]